MSNAVQRGVWIGFGAGFVLAVALTAAVCWRTGMFAPAKATTPISRQAPPITESVDVRRVPEAGVEMRH